MTTRDPEALAGFYARVLDLPEVRRQSDVDGVRSVWLDAEGLLLMVERGEPSQGFVMMFAVPPGSGASWTARLARHGVAVDGRTPFSMYARDPDGRRFGVSAFPEPLDGC